MSIRFCTANRASWRWLTLALCLFALVSPASGEVNLDSAQRQLLESLVPVTGAGISAGAMEGKPVVLSFFASWCPPCRTEFKHMNHLREEFSAAAVTIAAVNVFEEFDENDAARMDRFLSETQPSFQVLRGNAAVIESFGNIARIPTVFVFDREGKVLLHFIHRVDARQRNPGMPQLQAAVRAALN